MIVCRDLPHALSEGDICKCASNSHGCVGADLSLIVGQATVCALRRQRDEGGELCVESKDLSWAAGHVKPSALR